MLGELGEVRSLRKLVRSDEKAKLKITSEQAEDAENDEKDTGDRLNEVRLALRIFLV